MAESQLSDKAEAIERHLVEQLAESNDDVIYIKSAEIAEDLGLSSREVGGNIIDLDETNSRVEVTDWSYTSCTTWKVEPR